MIEGNIKPLKLVADAEDRLETSVEIAELLP